MATDFAVGSLLSARGREWVVLPASTEELLVVRPLGGTDDDVTAILPALEQVSEATFPAPDPADLGDFGRAGLLRAALRVGFRSSAGPFRSLAGLTVQPRPYQLVPLLMALRQETVRLLIADDVGIGKTVEAGLVAAELLAQGEARGLTVLCGPALAEQWHDELRAKFGIDAEPVLPGTVTRLERTLVGSESLFERYPYTIVSTDFIKSPRRRHEFVRACPDLVIVDEAHTCVADDSRPGASRMLRHELLRELARDAERHLLLVTATPHSGKEESFRALLGLLDAELATVDLEVPRNRERLARHFVQRRRADIRRYLDESTPFPRDRQSREIPYTLTDPYRRLFTRVLEFAREQVRDEAGGPVRQRVRWWSALALLRALSSSPRAAAATLSTRAAAGAALTAEEADTLGRSTVLDQAGDEALESVDVTPGADTDPEEADADEHRDGAAGAADASGAGPGGKVDTATRARLQAMARAARELEGAADAKLAVLTGKVEELLAEDYAPIVFCRFIDTAEYVAEHLTEALGPKVTVAAVTGTLPPAERVARIAELTGSAGRHVLVATDCLSEGINMQEHFQAVIHYDLAWNPTRHEQREGRVDRFGQPRDVVRVLTLYGEDTGIDGIVLNVLIRKHEAIRRATGVSVPVPAESNSLVEALMEGVLLRGHDTEEQLELDLAVTPRRDALHEEWQSAAEQERQSRTKYAQVGIRPEEVAEQVEAVRAALGSPAEITEFTREALRALGATITTDPATVGAAVFTASTGALPHALRDALPERHADPLPFHTEWPAPTGSAVLTRTDTAVEAVARYVLDAALDPTGRDERERPARRCGVSRTRAVAVRTTLLLVRYRFHLTLPARSGDRQVVAEDAQLLAFRGRPSTPEWLPAEETRALLAAAPDANVPPDQARVFAERAVAALPELLPALDGRGEELAEQLRAAHRAVRDAAGAVKRNLRVVAQRPADVLGVYVYLPVHDATQA